jgi:competence protein ComEC
MPLFWLSLAFLSGVVLGKVLDRPIYTWLTLAALSLVLLLVRFLFKRFNTTYATRLPSLPQNIQFPIPLPLLLIVLALGGARYQVSQPAINSGFIAYYNDQEGQFVLEGLLTTPPDVRDTDQQLRIQVERLQTVDRGSSTPVKGLLLVSLPTGGDWRYGDRLQLTGWLQTPTVFEDFSYRDYLARQGIYSQLQRASATLLARDQGNSLLAWIYSFKDRCVALIYRLFPDPEASLLAGILLGVYSGIPPGVSEAFRAAGVSHIIVISGFNMTIVAGLFAVVFGRLFGRRWGAVAAVLGITFYTLLVGATPSVVRAAIMAGLSLFAAQVGRRQDGLNTLAFVAALMALFNPAVLWDVSFQLTFLATLGLVLYAEPLSRAFMNLATRRLPTTKAQRLVGPVGEFFLFTIAAQVTTLAVMAYYFQRLSLVSLLSNPLILPAQPAVEILGGLALILGLIWQPLGQLVAYLAWPFLVYTIRAAEWFAALSGSTINLGQVALPLVLLFYVVLFGLTFAGPSMKKFAPVLKPSLVLGALGVLAVLGWRAVLSAPDGRLHMTLLDVGGGGRSGDAILIQTPSGRNLLIDGGPSTNRLSDGVGRRLPFGQRRLDWLVVAASQDGQVGGLARNLDRFPPIGIVWADPSGGGSGAGELRQRLADAEIDVIPAQVGQAFDLGNGAFLRVLAVGSRGAVLLLEWGSFRVLLPIGLDERLLKDLREDPSLRPVTALLLAGNGSSQLNPPEWIAKLRPQVALLSVDPSDTKDQPDPATLQSLQGYSLLRTDLNGWIELSTDRERMWVEAERR